MRAVFLLMMSAICLEYSQLPLAYLGLDALQRWLRDFLDYSVSVREAVRTLGDGSAVPASGTGDAAPAESGATFIKV